MYGGSFWSFLDFTQTSQIDLKVADPNTMLEDLLNDENIISEVKNANRKLLNYFTDKKIKQLISYIIEEPPSAEDKDRAYKFPFISQELLTTDVDVFYEAFFGRNPTHLRKKSVDSEYSSREIKDESEPSEPSDSKSYEVDQNEDEIEDKNKDDESSKQTQKTAYEAEEAKKEEDKKEKDADSKEEKPSKDKSHEQSKDSLEMREIEQLESEEIAKYFFSFLESDKLNMTLVGYFSRFLQTLLDRKEDDISRFVWKNSHIIDRLIFHIDHQTLAESLAKLFTLTSEDSDVIALKEQKFKKFVENLNADLSVVDREKIYNTCYVIRQVYHKIKASHSQKEYLSFLESNEFLDILFNNFFRDPLFIRPVIFILYYYIEPVKHDLKLTFREDLEIQQNDNKEDASETYLQKKLKEKAGEIVETLKTRPKDELSTTFGAKIAPFGVTLTKLLEFVDFIFKSELLTISLELANKGLFQVLMDLMATHEWNNTLHRCVFNIFLSSLTSSKIELRRELLHEAKLLDFLTKCTKETTYTMPNPQHRKLRKGYLGYITLLGRALKDLKDKDDLLNEYLDNTQWRDFNEKYLQPTLTKDNADLAKADRKASEEFVTENNVILNSIEDIIKKREEFGGYSPKYNTNTEEEGDDDFNDREDDIKENGNDFGGKNPFSDYGNFDEWGKKDTHGESQKDNKDLWSMSPADFSMTFKFSSFPGLTQDMENDEERNKYLELNRKLEVIDIGPQHEATLEQAYFDNAYWARPKNQGHNIDDIMKELDLN